METMLAAAAKVDITPFLVNETYLAGFAPNRLATGVAEPLTARVLYLEDANGPMVWIACDLIGLMQPDIDALREKLRDFAPERVFACATHTHSGPDTMGLWGPADGEIPYKSGRDPEYIKWLIDQLAVGVQRARARRRPALFGFAEDLRDKQDWVINIRQHGYNDKAMPVMRVDGVDGRPIACLTNFACHPETLWDRNTMISPDYVHYLHKAVEDATGAVSIFINGALGGMVTANLPDDTPQDKRVSFTRKLGKALGQMVVEAWRRARPEPVSAITHRRRRQGFPFDNKLLYFMTNLGIFDRKPLRGQLETSVDFWRIGPAQFASLPGEALPAIGFAAKRLMSGSPNFLFCLGNDELGYLLNHEQADDPTYHYERSVSVGPDAAEMFVQIVGELANQE